MEYYTLVTAAFMVATAIDVARGMGIPLPVDGPPPPTYNPHLPGSLDQYGFRIPYYGYAGYSPVPSPFDEDVEDVAARSRGKRQAFPGGGLGFGSAAADGLGAHTLGRGFADRGPYGSTLGGYSQGSAFQGSTTALGAGIGGGGYSPFGGGAGLGLGTAAGHGAHSTGFGLTRSTPLGTLSHGAGSGRAYLGEATSLGLGQTGGGLGLGSGRVSGLGGRTVSSGTSRVGPHGASSTGFSQSSVLRGHASSLGVAVA